MRFGGFLFSTLAIDRGRLRAHRASRGAGERRRGAHPPLVLSGVWDGVSQTTIANGMGAGDTRIEKQEWHLTQAGEADHRLLHHGADLRLR